MASDSKCDPSAMEIEPGEISETPPVTPSAGIIQAMLEQVVDGVISNDTHGESICDVQVTVEDGEIEDEENEAPISNDAPIKEIFKISMATACKVRLSFLGLGVDSALLTIVSPSSGNQFCVFQ